MKQMLQVLISAAVWRHRDLRLMLPGRAISAFGDEMALIALLLRVYAHGAGPWSITGLLLCFAAPVALFGTPAGRLVDALPFRRLAIGSAVWQAGCCAGLALATPLWSTYLLVATLQVGAVVAGPTWQALVPEIAERDELGAVVGVSQALTRTASVAAPAVAGLTAGALGYAIPLWVDAGTFVALTVAAALIRATRTSHRDESTDEGSERSYALRSDPLLWPLLVGLCVLILVGELTNVVEVFLVRGTLGASSFTFGLIAAVLGGAIVLGATYAGRAAPDALRASRAVVAALGLGLALTLGGLAPTLWLFVCAWVLVGLANGCVNVDVSTLLLRRTPGFCRGRVLARVNAMARGSTVGALAFGGAAGSLLGARETFVGSGALLALLSIVLLVRIRQVTPLVPEVR